MAQRLPRALARHAAWHDEQQLTDDIVALTRRYGRYGYRKIAELLRSQAGWVVNDKRVERIWRQGPPSYLVEYESRGKPIRSWFIGEDLVEEVD